MIWNDIIYGLGKLFSYTFEILKITQISDLNSVVNIFYIGIIFFLIIIWIIVQGKYNKEAVKNNTLK